MRRPNYRLKKIVEYFRSGDKKRTGFKLCYGGDKVRKKVYCYKRECYDDCSNNVNFMIGETADSYFERRFKFQPKYAVISEP